MADAIIVHDGKDAWVVRPGDPMYDAVSQMERDRDGVVHVSRELVSKVRGWWWDKALESVKSWVEGLGIPWDEIKLSAREAREAELAELTGRLALLTHYITEVDRELAKVEAQLTLSKQSLEQVVNRRLAEDSENKSPIGPRSALIVASDKRLRDTKIAIMEVEAYRKMLERTRSALEMNWKLVSRLISARLREPVE